MLLWIDMGVARIFQEQPQILRLRCASLKMTPSWRFLPTDSLRSLT